MSRNRVNRTGDPGGARCPIPLPRVAQASHPAPRRPGRGLACVRPPPSSAGRGTCWWPSRWRSPRRLLGLRAGGPVRRGGRGDYSAGWPDGQGRPRQLAHRLGPGIGGLLNATFGNAAELILALFALFRKGLDDVVKASLTGSIIGNLLLVLGASLFAGGLRSSRSSGSTRRRRATGSTLMFLADGRPDRPRPLPLPWSRRRPGGRPRASSLSLAVCVLLDRCPTA